jgi:hypothetical protein
MWSILASAAGGRQFERRLACSFCGRGACAAERLVAERLVAERLAAERLAAERLAAQRLAAGAPAYICDSCIRERVTVLQREGGLVVPERDRTNPTH